MNKQFGLEYNFAIILILTLLLSGCASGPTPTPVPTIPLPTPTLAAMFIGPTVTPTPEPSPVPPTDTPSPTVIATLPPPATATVAVTAALVPTIAPTLSITGTTVATTQTVGNSTDTCLGCHGPFEKLVSETANYLWENGDKQSPHKFVPHESTDAKDIVECTNCHVPHPLPPTSSDIAAMGTTDPKWCYGCHHTQVLQCGTCHE